eukprot:GHVH01004883.1.p1 GENE.GHVH01004883.1~~GHVH01004883.1.p1  ORF type:complete len:346 (-),score=55.93 GHVH01004883.1:122-1081(-)
MSKPTEKPWLADDRLRYSIELSVLMRIYKGCRKNYPSAYSGSLLGLHIPNRDTGVITVDITDIIPTTDKTTILNIAKYVGNDCEIIGHFKSSEGVDHQSSDTDTIFTLRGSQSTSSMKKNHSDCGPPALMIICDPMAGDADALDKCFTVLRLGPDGEQPLVPVKITTRTTALQRAFLFELSLVNDDVHEALNDNIGPLKMKHSSSSGKKLYSIQRSLDELTNDQDAHLRGLKDAQRHSQRVSEWLEKRRLENQNRYLQDLEPLPITQAAAIKAVGDPPSSLADNQKLMTTTASIINSCDELIDNQRETVWKQIVISSAF